MIPIFDSNAHPTLSGRWFGKQHQPSFENFRKELRRDGVRGACAVGLWNVEGYTHTEFMQQCSASDKVVPVAGFAPSGSDCIERDVKQVKSLGYRGIKIHPASCQTDLVEHKEKLVATLSEAQRHKLVVMYCTFVSSPLSRFPSYDPLWALADVLKQVPKCRVVLVHGGVTRLLLYAELVRFNANLLLDLSYTIMRYRGTSLENDLRFLFQNLDQRLCIGTDYPEYTIGQLRNRLDGLSSVIEPGKIENICYGNIMRFFELPVD